MAEAHKIDVILSAIDKASSPLKRITGGFNLLSKEGLAAGATFAAVSKGLDLLINGINDFIATIQKAGANKVHYFTINSIVNASEGALPSAKQKLRENLTWQNIHVNKGYHSDQIKFTSDFIRNTYKVNVTNNALNPNNLSFENIEPLQLNLKQDRKKKKEKIDKEVVQKKNRKQWG